MTFSTTFFQDFQDLIRFSCQFQIFKIFTCFKAYFDLKQLNRHRLWRSPNCVPFTLLSYYSLSYIVLALSTWVNNLWNKTLIFHDFRGLEMKFINSTTLHVFHNLYEPCDNSILILVETNLWLHVQKYCIEIGMRGWQFGSFYTGSTVSVKLNVFLPPLAFLRRLKQQSARTTMARRRKPATPAITAIIQSLRGSALLLSPGIAPAVTETVIQLYQLSDTR